LGTPVKRQPTASPGADHRAEQETFFRILTRLQRTNMSDREVRHQAYLASKAIRTMPTNH